MNQKTTLWLILLLVTIIPAIAQDFDFTPDVCADRLQVPIEALDTLTTGCGATGGDIPMCPEDSCNVIVYPSTQPLISADPTSCEGMTIIAQDRAGVRSLTCEDASGFIMTMYVDGFEYMIFTSGQDPLPVALFYAGSETTASSDALKGQLPAVPANALLSSAPSGPPSVDLSACSGMSAEDDARCIASRAVEEDSLDLCAAAIDAYACSVAVMETIDDPCADADDALTCMIEFATDTGLEAACETLPEDAQGTCFVFAAATSGDLSLVERRFPPGDERDTVYATLAVSRKDPTIIEEIEDNYTYDGARVLLMLPMVLETGEAPPEDYCETLRGNYDRDFGDYPEDATLHYDSCGRLIVIAQQLSTMNEDEQASFLIDQLRATGNPEDAALADQMEAAFEALEDE